MLRLPSYTTDAPESRTGNARSVIVFRMRPLDTRAGPSTSILDRVAREGVEHVALEQQWTEKAFLAPRRREDEAERREQKLVEAFQEQLVRQGHSVDRLKIVPPGEAKPLFCDLIDNTTNTLYEAKGTVERGSIRMAIGELLDYARFVQPRPRLAALLPRKPRADLLELLASAASRWSGRRVRSSPGRLMRLADPERTAPRARRRLRSWIRRRPESNRCRRLCRPLRSHSATSPRSLTAYRAVRVQRRVPAPGPAASARALRLARRSSRYELLLASLAAL